MRDKYIVSQQQHLPTEVFNHLGVQMGDYIKFELEKDQTVVIKKVI